MTPPTPDDPPAAPAPSEPDSGDGPADPAPPGPHDDAPSLADSGDGDDAPSLADSGDGPGPPGQPDPGDFLGEFDRQIPRRRWPMAVVGLMVIAALVAATVLVRGASSGDGERAGDDQQSPATTAAEPATESELTAVVSEISAFVAAQRGVEFLEPVTVELESEGEFQDRLLADFDDDADELRQTEVFLEGFGLVDPEVDMVAAMRSLLGGGVVGFYDPETDELVVRGAALTPYVRTTIAHELVHALDDQHHDLDRPEYDDAQDEIGFGFGALVEGNARRIENTYRDSLSPEEREQADEEELSLSGGIDVGSIPMILIDLITAPYTLGEPLVEGLVGEGGEGLLDASLADPPRTSEQVLEPERYTAREGAVDVPPPAVAGEVVDEGVIGQLLVLLVLVEELGIDDAREAASGWGGDWGVAWRDGERSCVTATLVGDDGTDTDQMRRAFERWAEAQESARVDATAGGGPFTVESCSA
jgi:hypothetical protein